MEIYIRCNIGILEFILDGHEIGEQMLTKFLDLTKRLAKLTLIIYYFTN